MERNPLPSQGAAAKAITDDELIIMKHLERDLERLQRDVLGLAAAVEEIIHRSISALYQRDTALAQQLIDSDEEVDARENQVCEECFQALALHQPVAGDLRRIVSIIMISTDLERMADLAVEIAERAQALAKETPIPIPVKLRQMTDLTTTMVHQSLDAFVNQDVELAKQVCRMDDVVDRLNSGIIDEIVGLMKQSTAHIEPGLSLFSAVRHLERIADHATNIAEDVVYLVEGRIIRHHPEAIDVS
jgi:phosphate transport system protein